MFSRILVSFFSMKKENPRSQVACAANAQDLV